MLRMGFIGQGSITSVHYAGYQTLKEEGFEISIDAIADIRPEMLEKHDAPRKYADYNELLEAEVGKLDFVDICLPTFLHAPAAIKAMELGYNVLVEKPMALNYELCMQMCETAKKTGKLLMVAQCCRFSNFADAVRDYMSFGELGAVRHACFKRDDGTPRWAWENWFLDGERSGGALLDLHVHDVDLLNSLFGVPKYVSSGGGIYIEGDGVDYVSSNYYYDNGLYNHSTGGWVTNNQSHYGRIYRVDFEKGHMIQTVIAGKQVFKLCKADGEVIDLNEKYPPYCSYTAEIRYFTDCLVKGLPVTRCLPESTADSIRIARTEEISVKNMGERIAL